MDVLNEVRGQLSSPMLSAWTLAATWAIVGIMCR